MIKEKRTMRKITFTPYFYEKGIDITNDKQMFEFIKNHFTYFTMNSWNCTQTIANKVKIYNLGLEGDAWRALNLLEADEYFEVNETIRFWEYEHPGYSVGFNGRSGGYLVLYNKDNYRSVLPDFVEDCDTYEEYKAYCKDYFGCGVKYNRRELKELCQLIQDFDMLCDELRDYVNELSKQDPTEEILIKAVDTFNEYYDADLERIECEPLEITKEGDKFVVDITDIRQLLCLVEAFCRTANDYLNPTGYKLKIDGNKASIVEK